VAEVEGSPAAALCGYVDPDLGNETLSKSFSEVKKVLGLSDDEVKARFQRYSSILNVAPEHEDGTWVVENVATKPEFRRKGLVDRLLNDIFEKGRRKGAEIADISVIIGNHAAQAAYEKNGFKVIGEKRHPEFEKAYGSPGIRTLSQRL
jgi:ribosomal protein S18 acetylase RimI-like enzyme